MRTARRLMKVVAPAVAAMALAAGPAYGDIPGTENGPSNLDNGVIGITCTSSDIVITLQSSGAGSIDALSFGGCTEVVSGAACALTVTGLPQAFQVTSSGALKFIGPPFMGIVIDCGVLTCVASADSRLTAVLIGGANPTRLNIVNQPLAIGGDVGCGVGTDANWNASWTLNS
jgi:hypothetical protein